MAILQNNSSGNFLAFNREIAKDFQRAMTAARDNGQARNLSAQEICVAIAVAANHCMALACISGDLPIDEFDGMLAQDVADTKARHAAHKAAKERPPS